ncbi:hypothetical protein PCASD_21422 [Puccinia coronata f. sp. avenae]|uniref:Myosin motor domain-containing protein n=1 Tax=Puccinia coronata f. sp. avenae TaxID=200324 RepID=A0A2N5SGP1_9BASI|nr:hypothetical protein PCASD_21422 [Puccinia coronata f. sp. avenae]
MGPSTPPGHSPGFQDSIYTCPFGKRPTASRSLLWCSIKPLKPPRTLDTSDHSSREYQENALNSHSNLPFPPPPHLYQVASDDSLRRICRTQAVVYSSGLSGSGKSTSMQLITKQLIKLSQLNSLGPSSQTLKLADQIPPLPESLSNPSTTAPPCGHTHQPACLTSTPPRLLPLRPASIVLGCYRIPICPDVDQIGFDDLQAAFRSLGFKSEHIQSLYRRLSAILLLIHYLTRSTYLTIRNTLIAAHFPCQTLTPRRAPTCGRARGPIPAAV